MKKAKKAVFSLHMFSLDFETSQSYQFYFRHNCFQLRKNYASFKIDQNIADVNASFGNQICRETEISLCL